MGRSDYERIRAAHLNAVQVALDDHVGRLDWSAEQIQRHLDQGLRSLLAYTRERSPFYADRLRGIDVERATTADLASIPMLTKAEAQGEWDAIVTTPDLDREAAERILNEQAWFSYTRHDEQVFSSGGSGGVRGVYVWDCQFFITTACLAWRMQARDERRGPSVPNARLAVLTAGVPPHASTPLFDVPTAAGMQTVVIEAGAPFDEVLAAVDEHASTAPALPWRPTNRRRAPWPPACRTVHSLRAIRPGRRDQMMSEPCPCGSAFARVADISGRRDDDFAYGSHSVPASAFRHVLGTDPRIVEYQVVQTEGGANVLVVAGADVQSLVPALVSALQRYGVADPSIRLRAVETLGRNQASGKLKRFVPLPPR